MEKLPEPLRRFGPFLGVALVLVVGYLAYGQLSGGAAHEAEAEAGVGPTPFDLEAAADAKEDRQEDEVAGPVVSLGEPLVVNLGDPGLRATVRVAVSLQVDEGTPLSPGAAGGAPRLAEEAEARHVAIATLGALTSANLLEPGAREDVRKLLVRRLNRSLPATLVLAAYFTELTVADAAAGAEPADLKALAKGPQAEPAEDEEEAAEAADEDAEHGDEEEHAESEDDAAAEDTAGREDAEDAGSTKETAHGKGAR